MTSATARQWLLSSMSFSFTQYLLMKSATGQWNFSKSQFVMWYIKSIHHLKPRIFSRSQGGWSRSQLTLGSGVHPGQAANSSEG